MKKHITIFLSFFILISHGIICADCSFNPDIYLTTPQIIKRHGYPSESHVIETIDGYLLTLHRIPGNKHGIPGRTPVFLQHGLLASSADWVVSGQKSLGFLLADAGYDVWLGNARGNIYSKAHVSISPDDKQFWNFSFHEMGLYDLPAAIYHITNTTDKCGEIIYIGHSMGTTMFYIFASTFPQYSESTIHLMISMAPAVHMTHVRSPIKYLAPLTKKIQYIFRTLGVNEFLPSNIIMKFLSAKCKWRFSRAICKNIVFLLSGYDSEQLDEDLLPVVLSHTPSGTSTKTVVHFSQEINSKGKFQHFDYGEEDNMKQYGQKSPPLYKIEDILVPVYLMYSLNDWMCSPQDVTRLSTEIERLMGVYEVPFEKFNHVDFLWAKDADKLVYKPMMEFMRNYTEDTNVIDEFY